MKGLRIGFRGTSYLAFPDPVLLIVCSRYGAIFQIPKCVDIPDCKSLFLLPRNGVCFLDNRAAFGVEAIRGRDPNLGAS